MLSELSDIKTIGVILTIQNLQAYLQCTSDLAAAILDLSLPATSVSLAVFKICSASSVT